MKKLIILPICLLLMTGTAMAMDEYKNTSLLHKAETLNYVDKNLDVTLDLYKIVKTSKENSSIDLMRPLNIHLYKTKLTLKQKRKLKRIKFFQSRRTRKFKRWMKKLQFYKDRRKKKFKRSKYLFQWFQLSAKAISSHGNTLIR